MARPGNTSLPHTASLGKGDKGLQQQQQQQQHLDFTNVVPVARSCFLAVDPERQGWRCPLGSQDTTAFIEHLHAPGTLQRAVYSQTIPFNAHRDWLSAGGEGGDREEDGWMASSNQQTWVRANSGQWWRTGKPGVWQSTGSQTVRHDLVTEQQ